MIEKLKRIVASVMLVAIILLAPMHHAEAKGGGGIFSSPIFSIVMTFASLVVFPYAIAPMLGFAPGTSMLGAGLQVLGDIAPGVVDGIASAVGVFDSAIASITDAIGITTGAAEAVTEALAMSVETGASGLQTLAALDAYSMAGSGMLNVGPSMSSLFGGLSAGSAISGALSIGSAVACIAGVDTAYPGSSVVSMASGPVTGRVTGTSVSLPSGYSGCGGDGGSSDGGSSASEAAIEANTTTASTTLPASQGGEGATCPDGYYIASVNGSAACLPTGYVSCDTVNHPEAACPSNTQCIDSAGQAMCQSKTGSCVATSGQACSSTANSCGLTNQGQRLCDGTCPAATPPDTDCAPPTISLSAVPSLINPGSVCTVGWEVTDSTTCSLSSDIGDSIASTTRPTGSHDSPALTTPATYTMLCRNGNVVTSSVSVTCRLNPAFQNI